MQRGLAAFHLDKLVETVEQAGADLELQATARRSGKAAGRRQREAGPCPPVDQVLAGRGYEPYRDGAMLRLRNCPFANLAEQFPVLAAWSPGLDRWTPRREEPWRWQVTTSPR